MTDEIGGMGGRVLHNDCLIIFMLVCLNLCESVWALLREVGCVYSFERTRMMWKVNTYTREIATDKIRYVIFVFVCVLTSSPRITS